MTDVYPMIPASGRALWTLGGITLLLALLLGLFAYFGYASQHVRFEVSPTGLRVVGDLYGRTIPLPSLRVDMARRLDLGRDREYRPRWRTFGTGLPGYSSGWFRLRNGEKALLYVTDRARVVYIPTREGYSVLLSVPDPDAFLRSLARVSARA